MLLLFSILICFLGFTVLAAVTVLTIKSRLSRIRTILHGLVTSLVRACICIVTNLITPITCYSSRIIPQVLRWWERVWITVWIIIYLRLWLCKTCQVIVFNHGFSYFLQPNWLFSHKLLIYRHHKAKRIDCSIIVIDSSLCYLLHVFLHHSSDIAFRNDHA